MCYVLLLEDSVCRIVDLEQSGNKFIVFEQNIKVICNS